MENREGNANAYEKYLESCKADDGENYSRQECKYDARDTFNRWIECTDLEKLFGKRCASMRRMYINYIMYCVWIGVYDAYSICTDREFSRMLQEHGLKRKRMSDGFWFVFEK